MTPEAAIAELTAAHGYLPALFGGASLSGLQADLRSGDPKKVSNALAAAKKIISAYHADRYPEPKRPGEDDY